ncbi:hypothetical protein N7447_000477 [Penicillium robsamsonii]|uniref:uncharacterized protein n=1 Tax=Penicillium robsamsonii TaxID=1792511 RepID=UPI0025494EF4|nr:uncharacterized protein N7447_000477 [Penicillium robsamsonii]KAJ5834451.1 hypothetical protein N7447_000477 [Penicillium robsamsonii]
MEEGSTWQQVRTYADHLGHRVVLEEYMVPDPEPGHLVPIQVYSLVPLDDDHEKLREYLMQTFCNDEVLPMFEIYSYRPPDAFACIEHNRFEIARRKQQHRSGVENAPPLIPKFTGCSDKSIPIGFCVLVRSHSYRLGETDSDELAEAGEGPDMLYFNRSFSSTRSDVDETQRSDEYGNPSPEAFELATERIKNQNDVGDIVVLNMFGNVGRAGATRDALDIDEGEPPSSDMLSEEQIRGQLSQESAVSGFSLDPAYRVTRDSDVITISNTPKGNLSDIQYIIHALFLGSIRDIAGSTLLESTARLFTASIVSRLPANKTITFKFFIPKSPTWAAIRPAQSEVIEVLSSQPTHEENREDPFLIGALHTFYAGNEQSPITCRMTPQRSDAYLSRTENQSWTPYRLFTVVLDRAKFVSEAGIYFYKAYWDSTTDLDPYAEDAPHDTDVVRGVDLSTTAGRLGLVVFDR